MQKAIRIAAIVLIVGFIGYLFITSAINTGKAQKEPWHKAMTLGDIETAEHIFYDYTDIMCPYCDKFALAMDAHLDEFKKDYIEDKKVYYEIRLTDLLSKYHPEDEGMVSNSHLSARAGYCAADKDKFWEYYSWILGKLDQDYFSKDIGTQPGKEKIPQLETEYFTAVGEDIEGLDSEYMASCIGSNDTIATVNKYTSKASGIVKSGLPYYVFDKYTAPGFAGNWEIEHDWQQARLLFDAGIASKK